MRKYRLKGNVIEKDIVAFSHGGAPQRFRKTGPGGLRSVARFYSSDFQA
jgi:hypothetical protein